MMSNESEQNQIQQRANESERQRDELAKRCEEAESLCRRLHQVLDLAPEYFYAVDENGRVIWANAAAARFYDTTTDAMIGARLADIDPNSDQPDLFIRQIAETIAQGEPRFFPEMEVVDGRGNTRYVQFNDIPYVEVGTGRRAVLGVASDLTARKHFEIQMREKQRIEHDLEIARSIQQSLLPTEKPNLPGFEIAGWSQPADRTGGDYYDWLALPDGRIAVTIADATGHGIGPALIIAVCRAYFRAAHAEPDPLEGLLSRVNELLSPDLTMGRFVTAAVGLIDPSSSRMHLFSAGHGPTFFYEAAHDKIHCWYADDLPLGVMSSPSEAMARSIDFSSGDVLVMVTDGLFEWANTAGEMFGIDRLARAIREHHKLGAQVLIEKLHEMARMFAEEGKQEDDITVVVLKRNLP